MNARNVKILLVSLVASTLALLPPSAHAGCGCSKPAPALADVRPHVTWPGSAVTLFHAAILPGVNYSVVFQSGTTPSSAQVSATGVSRLDLADGILKTQLVVSLPELPLGPTAIEVFAPGAQAPLLSLADTSFLVAPAPIAVSEELGTISVPNQQAAVTRDGVVYFSLDLTGIEQPRIFEAQLQGYPLRFTFEDVVFYNRQGFLMQKLDESMPGLFSIAAPANAADSDVLRYSRHEFSTFFLQHDERDVHALDPNDPNWHLDGTPHIDHNHLVVAILGWLDDGNLPPAGSTPVFDLELRISSLFEHGLVAIEEVKIENSAGTTSWNSVDGSIGHAGDVRAGKKVNVGGQSVVDGSVTAPQIHVTGGAVVTGSQEHASLAEPYAPVAVPEGLVDLGDIDLAADGTETLSTGSYRIGKLKVRQGSTLIVDNTSGPVTLYVTGDFKVEAPITVVDGNPENFSVYIAGTSPVTIKESGSFLGVLYAPASDVKLENQSSAAGAVVAKRIEIKNDAVVQYDTALRGAGGTP